MTEKEGFFEVIVDGKKQKSLRNDFKLDNYSLRERQKEQRKDRRDFVTHILASAIIGSFLILVMHQVLFLGKIDAIPVYFVSIVSTVVGFYFGGKLFHNH